jgi:hypothetical protein
MKTFIFCYGIQTFIISILSFMQLLRFNLINFDDIYHFPLYSEMIFFEKIKILLKN